MKRREADDWVQDEIEGRRGMDIKRHAEERKINRSVQRGQAGKIGKSEPKMNSKKNIGYRATRAK